MKKVANSDWFARSFVSPPRKQPGQAGPEVEPVRSPVLLTLSGVNDKVG